MCRGGRACGGGRGLSAVTGTNQRRFRNPAGANRAGFFITFRLGSQASKG